MLNRLSFKPGPEDCDGRCGSDKISQTVPDTSSGDRESLVTNGWTGVFSHKMQHELQLVFLHQLATIQLCSEDIKITAEATNGIIHTTQLRESIFCTGQKPTAPDG